MPLERWRYPEDWEAISRAIRDRARGRCEGPPPRPRHPDQDEDGRDPSRCWAMQGEPHPVTGSRVILTVAHVFDPDPMNCAPENLAALCQRCHLNWDRPHHVAKARARRRARKATGDLFDP